MPVSSMTTSVQGSDKLHALYWVRAVPLPEGLCFIWLYSNTPKSVRTPLVERSVRRTDLYLTTHNTHNRYPCPQRDRTRNPSTRVATDLHLRPRHHRHRFTSHLYIQNDGFGRFKPGKQQSNTQATGKPSWSMETSQWGNLTAVCYCRKTFRPGWICA